MKALITGPRSGLSKNLNLPYMHLEIDYEEVPKVGETIILNGGNSYTVERVMWWVQGPENDAYWNRDGNYETQADHQVVHIHVQPSDHVGHDLYTEGKAAGHKEAAADLQRIVDMAGNGGDAAVAAVVRGWLGGQK